MVRIAAPVEHHFRDALLLRALRHCQADRRRRRDIAAVPPGALVHRRRRHESLALRIVDDLRVDVRHAAEDRETRALRRARQLAPDALVNAAADFLLFSLTNHLPPAPVLPTFLRSASPVYRTPLFLYGSGLRSARIFAATWPSICRSCPLSTR